MVGIVVVLAHAFLLSSVSLADDNGGQTGMMEKTYCSKASGTDGGSYEIPIDLQHDKVMIYTIECDVDLLVKSKLKKYWRETPTGDQDGQQSAGMEWWTEKGGGDILVKKTCRALPGTKVNRRTGAETPTGQYDPALPWVTYADGVVMNRSVSGWGKLEISDAAEFATLESREGRILYLDSLYAGEGFTHLDATIHLRSLPMRGVKFSALVSELIYPERNILISDEQGGPGTSIAIPGVMGQTGLLDLEPTDCSEADNWAVAGVQERKLTLR